MSLDEISFHPVSVETIQPTYSGKGQQDQARLFIETLWNDNLPDGFLVLWTKTNRQSELFHTKDRFNLANRAQKLDLEGDVYFAIGMQKAFLNTGRGKADSVNAIPCFWLDVDIKGPNHKKENLIPSVDSAKELIARFPLKPSMIVSSGGGWHCYWIFNKSWIFESDSERKDAANLSKRFHQTFMGYAKEKNWEIDNTSDLARLLRIPGTHNHKNVPIMPVEIIEINKNRYNPDYFRPYLINDQMGTPVFNGNSESISEIETTHTANELGKINEMDSNSVNDLVVNKLIDSCAFLKHCKDNASDLSEPKWYKMICLLAHEHGGSNIIHELSRPYPKYKKEETDNYISKALKNSNSPITCKTIKQLWNCNQNCVVTSPIHLKQGILQELGICNSTSVNVAIDEDESFNEIDLLKERFPDVAFPWDSFPSSLSASLKDLSSDMAVQPEMCCVIAFGILSAAIGSIVKSVTAKKGYKTSVSLWIGIIAGTGEKKSPVFGRLMKPVHQFQKQKIDNYKKEHLDWENRQKASQKPLKSDPEPKQSSIYTTDPTIEALAELLSDNPHGIMLFQDEIAGFLLSFNQYRGGKGGDREKYLSLWSSTPIKIDRVAKKLYVHDPFLSLLGGIQPDKAVDLFKTNSFEDGLITRFLFYINPKISKKMRSHEWQDGYEQDWMDLITKLYCMDSSSKFELKLNVDAWDIFMKYENSLNDLSDYVPNMFSVFIPKATNYILRISGILHILELVIAKKQVSIEISADTVKRAINIVTFFLSQARKMVESFGPKKQTINTDSKQVFKSIMDIFDSTKNFTLTTKDIYEIYNKKVPKEAQIGTSISFGKLLVKTMKDFKIKYEKKRVFVDGSSSQSFILSQESLELIKKLLKS